MKDFFGSLESSAQNAQEKFPVVPINTGVDAISMAMNIDTVALPAELIATPFMDLIREGMRCFTEYQIAELQEETERQRIAARLQAIISSIEAKKEIHLISIMNEYAERDKLYATAMENLEIARKNHDNEMVKAIYNFILSVFEKGVTLSSDRIQLLGVF